MSLLVGALFASGQSSSLSIAYRLNPIFRPTGGLRPSWLMLADPFTIPDRPKQSVVRSRPIYCCKARSSAYRDSNHRPRGQMHAETLVEVRDYRYCSEEGYVLNRIAVHWKRISFSHERVRRKGIASSSSAAAQSAHHGRHFCRGSPTRRHHKAHLGVSARNGSHFSYSLRHERFVFLLLPLGKDQKYAQARRKKQFFTANQSCFFTRNACYGYSVKPCQFQLPLQK